MKKLIPALALLLMASGAYGFECKVCHSKNPAMVRMHKALQGRNCFDCHRMGEKLMGKGIPKDKAAQIKRRESEQICFECHLPPKASAAKPAN
ncbi:cytochrome C [Geoanaerobacter pelophilus]|uniref:Cytochrome C n=1 Tax=Geoanaerobacter pelophilus TaxID=60036 RepID=A0ABQ0MMZ2_9BACT|nr:cytochrome c3 family protein [Geoanaerobacter pelophilus]GAW68422.1 cytochrome C [Geoanaerobacter pelophilus]